ncbi:MAG: pectate lyase, partial [bacterium]|nr:pectate lyase [bacterium]
MNHNLRDIYAHKALAQVPRLLSLEDRNPFSPTYGCCNREYWLCRATDFPSAIAQFAVHALALAWRHPMPGNIYHQQDKVRDWTVAGIEYWLKIQKRDGSFDEFYPNERGWAGPTGFLLHAMIDSYRLLGDAFPDRLRGRFFEACEKAGRYLARWDEPGVLANHHAMAVLPVFEAARLLGSRELWDGYQEKLDAFYTYCEPEGWCLEYDGADPGYLSATVSFLGKIYKHRAEVPRVRNDRKLPEVMKRAVDF